MPSREAIALVAALALPACAASGHDDADVETLGRQVFETKCWGCHHTTSQAFGPSFRWIADHRSDALIRAQLEDPAATATLLGYARSVMPRLQLSEAEITAAVAFVRSAGTRGTSHAANEPVHTRSAQR